MKWMTARVASDYKPKITDYESVQNVTLLSLYES